MLRATYYYDAFGNIEEEKYYDANGNLTTTPINNNIRYAGYQYDEETELYYLTARMYDPKIARFLQEDTYRGDPNDPLSLNLYTYVKNNPLVYYDPTGHWPEWLDKKFENAKQWVNKKIKSVSDAASNVLNTAKNYVNEKVVQPVGQTIQKGKEVIEYVIENKPSSLKDGLALGTGIALTTFKNNVYDPFVDKVTAVDAIVSVGNYMEFYDEAQKRFEYFENNVTNSLGIQDNEYYYIGGTLTGAYNTIKGTAQFAGGTLIGVRGIRDTTIGIKGILSGGGTISLTLTAAGVGELMLAAEGSASGVFKASSGFDSFNRNYEKFAKMTEGTRSTLTSKDIRFTQDSISATFKDGSSVDDLINGLKSGKISPNDVPAIRIFEKDGVIYSLDNRRLYAFKEAGIDNINYVWATPEEIANEAWKMTTNNGGVTIRVRGR
ncbi:hypothetical protein JCM21531_4637 [Acetivibrio straminisolvens JCM 21531]|uniref:Uncharacterized protein n=1 Tax=Acetivibrio straminisolvens JCM 21531 TaxID=1294263 RepID=W4VDZ8_9FIRM|nr:hypothetical protein JCM21531_4637 [Acetivibrio straminisolvens JCM 21531]